MSKILRFLTCLFCIVFIGDAVFAAGYECPTHRQYTTCNKGYYLAYSYSGTSGSNLRHDPTPRPGNACRPCSDYDAYKKVAEGSHTCAGGTAGPVLNIVTITYNLNGGSGTKPANVSCKKGQTCTLDDGATTMFYRAGYVFKGWTLTSTETSGFTSHIFTANDTVYAVWEKCGLGEYKPGSGTQAAAACSSCPDLPTGFAYASTTGLKKKTECSAAAVNVGLLNENCRDEITSAPVRLSVGAEDDTDWTLYYTVPTTASMIRANPGAYVNPEILTEGIWQPYSNFNADELCKLCQDGTYNGNMSQTVTSCTACPSITATDEQVGWKVSTGGTGATSWEACYTYWNRHPSTCATGGYKREAISAGGYQEGMLEDPENPFTAIPGYYVTYTGGTGVGPTCVECSAGTYSPGGDVHSCSACPDLPTGFAYASTTGLKKKTECSAAAVNVGLLNENCRDEITSAPVRLSVGAEDDTDWTLYYTVPTTASMIRANPGAYVNPEILTEGIWQPYSNFNADELCLPCPDGTYNDGQNGSGKVVTECTACPGSTHPKLAELPVSTGGTGATGHRQCYKYIRLAEVDSNCVSGEVRYRCETNRENSINYQLYPIPAQDPELAPFAAPGHAVYLPNDTTTPSCIECGAGTYSAGGTVYSCSECPSGYDDNPETGLTSPDMCQISCPGGYYLAAANDATCSEVSPGYWAAEKIVNYGDTSTRTECASGLTTIGYGAGADEADDCGRVLHFGDDTLYLRSVKKTDHALHVGINGTVFYGNMGTDLSKRGLRIKLGDTTYSVYDDSM